MAELSVVLAGGGSAGHVNPLLATAQEIRRRHPDARIEVLGTAMGLEAELVPAAGYPLHTLPRARLPRRPSPEWFSLPGRLRQAVTTARRVIEEAEADVVVGYGGYVATPAYFAAKKLGVPVVVHEQNARPGLANKYGARHAAVVALTFASTPIAARRGKTVTTGLPLRAPIAGLIARRAAGEGQAAREEAAQALGLDPARPILLVTGGSLGAVSLNTAAASAATELTAAGQVLHLTGKGKSDAVREALAAAGDPADYHVREYLSEMELAYAVADLTLSRSGAGMVSELAALGIPTVYVPLPVGNGEQRLNAADVVAAGGGLLVEDSAIGAEWARTQLASLFADSGRLAEMGRKAAGTSPADGAARLVQEIEGLA